MIVASLPDAGGVAGGVYADGERMKKDAWRARMRRLRHCIIVGVGRNFFGIGGTPRAREERDKKTNDWSAA